MEAKTNNETERMGMAVTPSHGQHVIHLKERWYTQNLPGSHKGTAEAHVVLPSLGIDATTMVKSIDDVGGVKPAVIFEVSRAQAIELMKMITASHLDRGITNTFRLIFRSFRNQVVSLQDPVDRCDRRRFYSLLGHVPTDSKSPNLSVWISNKRFSRFYYGLLHRFISLLGHPMGFSRQPLGPIFSFFLRPFQPLVKPSLASPESLIYPLRRSAISVAPDSALSQLAFIHTSLLCLGGQYRLSVPMNARCVDTFGCTMC